MNKQGSIIPAIAGHIVDLFRLFKFEISHPHSWTKYRQLKAVARRTRSTQFVETGTYLGNTTHRCRTIFSKIYTIELDEKLFLQSSRYLSKNTNITCIKGDCLVELPKVLAKTDVSDVLIFLDGHYSKADTACGDQVEPACEEIEMLKPYVNKINAIVVDDFRTFNGVDGFPSKSNLLRSCEDVFGREFTISIHLDQVLVERVRF